MQTSIPPYAPIQTGDHVVCAGAPFINWLRAHDKRYFPKLRYDYDNLPPRSDKLHLWFWVRAEVVEINGDTAKLKSYLGTTFLPIHCLRKIAYQNP